MEELSISETILINKRLRTVANDVMNTHATMLIRHKAQMVVYSDNPGRIQTIVNEYSLKIVSMTTGGDYTIATLTA